jgi:branched-chain amino acid transport system ATP-binding protein
MSTQTETASGDHSTTPAQPAIELRAVSVHFGGVVALRDVSFSVAEREIVGLIGPNGAGKTTLLNVIAGGLSPVSGQAVVFGEKARRSAVGQARMGVGRTFQQLSLLSEFTVREHVLFGYAAGLGGRLFGRGLWYRKAVIERMADADDSPLGPKALMADLGLEPIADELAAEQSVGIARMVDMARALASRPRILLLDEPVSGLSEIESEAVARLLLDLRAQHGMTMIVVEHNLEFARIVSERIVALDFGEVIATGSGSEVLSSDRVRIAYFGTTEPTKIDETVAPVPTTGNTTSPGGLGK